MPRVTRDTTRARREKEQKRTRLAILDASESVFCTTGFHASTTDEIAHSAGVAVGTIYNFFGNKEKLYAAVVNRIASQIIERVKELSQVPLGTEKAMDDLIRFRLENHSRHRLFFVLFSCERSSGAYPAPEDLSDHIVSLYYKYLTLVAKIFEAALNGKAVEKVSSLHLALSLEGMLYSFMGYWSQPNQTVSPEEQVEPVRETFLGMMGMQRIMAPRSIEAFQHDTRMARELYITKFDHDRLKELIVVARAFGSPHASTHLADLEKELSRARIVDSKDIPSDVITMNSRVRIQRMDGLTERVLSVVFPASEKADAQNVSILAPLGTALLGCRVGDVVETLDLDGSVPYRVSELLYQPESAGDYHL